MLSTWQSVLTKTGAVFEGDEVAHFGDAQGESRRALAGDVLTVLSHFGSIEVSGADAERFLQGQLTSDVSAVDAHHSQLSAWCTPKGRVLASFRIFRRGDAYLLQLPRRMLPDVLTRLQRYVLRADVRLQDASDSLLVMGISGPNAGLRVSEVLGTHPEDASNAVCTVEETTVIRLPGPHARFMLCCPPQRAVSLWRTLFAAVSPVGWEAWSLLDIREGLPTVWPETSESFLPQMLNLQLLGGVSFSKGCYAGQEIVARTQHLGRLKRRLYLARTDEPTPPMAGDRLFGADGEGTAEVGTVVQAARHPDGGSAMLAVIEVAAVDGGASRLKTATGNAVRVEPPPYPLDG